MVKILGKPKYTQADLSNTSFGLSYLCSMTNLEARHIQLLFISSNSGNWSNAIPCLSRIFKDFYGSIFH